MCSSVLSCSAVINLLLAVHVGAIGVGPTEEEVTSQIARMSAEEKDRRVGEALRQSNQELYNEHLRSIASTLFLADQKFDAFAAVSYDTADLSSDDECWDNSCTEYVAQPAVALATNSGTPKSQTTEPPSSTGLAWLFGKHAYDKQHVLENVLDKEALHITAQDRRVNPDSGDLGISADLREASELLRVHQLMVEEQNTPGIMQYSKSDIGCHAYWNSETDILHKYGGNVDEAYLDGCTISCPHVAASWGPLAKKLSELQDDFQGVPWNANIYFSPRNASGFRLHNDVMPSFVVQVAGTKNWEVFNTKLIWPLRANEVGGPQAEIHKKGAATFSGPLNPGDVLHIPRGHLHRAWTSPGGGPSLHFTIAPWIYPGGIPCVADFLAMVVDMVPRSAVSTDISEFWNVIMSQAALGEARKRGREWLRALLPWTGIKVPLQKREPQDVMPLFIKSVNKWKGVLKKELKRQLGVGESNMWPGGWRAMDHAFELLLAHGEQHVVAAALKRTGDEYEEAAGVVGWAAKEFFRRRSSVQESLKAETGVGKSLRLTESQRFSFSKSWPFRENPRVERLVKAMRELREWGDLDSLLASAGFLSTDDHHEAFATVSALQRRLHVRPTDEKEPSKHMKQEAKRAHAEDRKRSSKHL